MSDEVTTMEVKKALQKRFPTDTFSVRKYKVESFSVSNVWERAIVILDFLEKKFHKYIARKINGQYAYEIRRENGSK